MKNARSGKGKKAGPEAQAAIAYQISQRVTKICVLTPPFDYDCPPCTKRKPRAIMNEDSVRPQIKMALKTCEAWNGGLPMAEVERWAKVASLAKVSLPEHAKWNS
jgi:hypothetical protein